MDANFKVNKILFDYWSYTIKGVEPEDVISMLGLDGVIFADLYGSKGYHHRYFYDGISISFGGREEIWVEMTGRGCRVYETYGNNDWFGLAYQILTNANAQMTRLDVAYDDFNHLLDMDKIRESVKTHAFVGRCKSITCIDDYDRNGVIGSTIMCGSRGSNISCRIYDKAQERGQADNIEHWVRCELQIRHKHADKFLYYLLAEDVTSIYGIDIDDNKRLDSLYFAVLNHFIRFVDLHVNNDTNVWRLPLAEHWRRFVESYKGNSVSLYTAPGVDYDVLKLRYIVEQQYGAMIYTYIALFGSDELEESVRPKEFKLNKKYRYILDCDDDVLKYER